ncbi:universal stress protein [Pseudorhizobium marinum]|uniref:universal stress protein n=1 Tax=Pseudorhizobium marinum TaxID=1496690 RepID=UPI0004961854|nr:universal stress protein [Pseudorhizobium marinum]
MKRIMVATDFSERSDRAIRRATLLARQNAAAVTLLTAVDDDLPKRIVDEDKRQAEMLLREMSATLQRVDGVECDTTVILAEASQAIIRGAYELAPDLVVIGPHRRQLFRDVFIGTTAERTVRKAPCPILMVNATPAASYRHIMMTTDLSEVSQDAIVSLVGLNLAGSANQSILHVYDAPILRLALSNELPEDEQHEYAQAQKASAYTSLRQFIASIPASYFAPVVRPEANKTSHEILACAAETNADLIVLATHQKPGLERMLLGSVAEQVLRDSPVDVLVIPPVGRD